LVGTDLVHVPAVADSLAVFPERYVKRVYSAREIADCTSEQGVDAARLAARFAAKEAVVKALRPRHGLSYRDIEVVLDAGGRPAMAFHGAAATWIDGLGLHSSSVSLTHDGDYAAAVFVAVASDQPAPALELPAPTTEDGDD
jgi:holo-[acyl-carrier protein] synthase